MTPGKNVNSPGKVLDFQFLNKTCYCSVGTVYSSYTLAVTWQVTLKCINIWTPKTINFSFVPNGKFMILGVPIFGQL